MKITNADHVAAPTPIVHKGKTYLQHPPTIGDFAAMRLYMIEQETAALDKSIASIQSKELRDFALAKGMNEIDEIEVNSARFNRLLADRPQYQAYFTWLVLRHHHPEITMETVYEIWSDNIATQFEAAREKLLAKAGYKESPNGEAPQAQAEPAGIK